MVVRGGEESPSEVIAEKVEREPAQVRQEGRSAERKRAGWEQSQTLRVLRLLSDTGSKTS